MFGPKIGVTSLSLGKVLGGVSKTLGVVNQVIPLYKEAKPMIQNARSAFNLIKEFGNSTTTRIMENKEKNIKPIKEKINTLNNVNLSNKNSPTFFQ